jgi:type IV pilus assembly protein PilF
MKQCCSVSLRLLLLAALSLSLFACATVQDQKREDKTRFRMADTNVRLGLGYLQQGRDEAALEKLQKAVDVMPEYAEAHSSIALAYERLEEKDKAGEHYQRAVELKPKDGSIQNNYAVFLCGQGKYVEAEQHFLSAIENRRYRTPALALENLGVCMLRIPDLKKAETYLRKALRMDPKLPGALLQMARVSVEMNKLMSGRAYLQRYQEVAALGPDGLWLGIQVEEKLGGKDAVQEYKTLLRQKYSGSNEMRLLLETEEKERARGRR